MRFPKRLSLQKVRKNQEKKFKTTGINKYNTRSSSIEGVKQRRTIQNKQKVINKD